MMSYILFSVVLIVISGQFTDGKIGQQDESCTDLYEPVGCFKDNTEQRAVGQLILTDRDESSPFYSGKNIDWGNFNVCLKSLACRCAQKAKENGFSYFGLQYYGECYSGAAAEITFDEYGESDDCVNGLYGECENPSDGECVGKGHANFVYKLKEEGSANGPAQVLLVDS